MKRLDRNTMNCPWCGVDFSVRPRIPKKLWDNRWECKNPFACNKRAKRRVK